MNRRQWIVSNHRRQSRGLCGPCQPCKLWKGNVHVSVALNTQLLIQCYEAACTERSCSSRAFGVQLLPLRSCPEPWWEGFVPGDHTPVLLSVQERLWNRAFAPLVCFLITCFALDGSPQATACSSPDFCVRPPAEAWHDTRLQSTAILGMVEGHLWDISDISLSQPLTTDELNTPQCFKRT